MFARLPNVPKLIFFSLFGSTLLRKMKWKVKIKFHVPAALHLCLTICYEWVDGRMSKDCTAETV